MHVAFSSGRWKSAPHSWLTIIIPVLCTAFGTPPKTPAMAGVGERGCCFGWLRRQHPSQGNREWRERSSLTDSACRGRAEVRDPVVPRVTARK